MAFSFNNFLETSINQITMSCFYGLSVSSFQYINKEGEGRRGYINLLEYTRYQKKWFIDSGY